MLRLPSGALIAEDFEKYIFKADWQEYIKGQRFLQIQVIGQVAFSDFTKEDSEFIWNVLQKGVHDVQPT